MTGAPHPAWLEAIREREKLLGADTVRRMADLFIRELEDLLSRASAELSVDNAQGAREFIHNLGGNAGCLDFTDLHNVIAAAEKACTSGKTQEARDTMPAISSLARDKAEQLRRLYQLS